MATSYISLTSKMHIASCKTTFNKSNYLPPILAENGRGRLLQSCTLRWLFLFTTCYACIILCILILQYEKVIYNYILIFTQSYLSFPNTRSWKLPYKCQSNHDLDTNTKTEDQTLPLAQHQVYFSFFFNLKELTFSHSTESSLFTRTKALQILRYENSKYFIGMEFPLSHFYHNCTKSQTGVAYVKISVSFPNPSYRIYSCCLSQDIYVENLKVLLTGSLLYNGS